ncbi:MAG: hypothetical protein WC299_03625 [Kiritimatiellia bacterium]
MKTTIWHAIPVCLLAFGGVAENMEIKPESLGVLKQNDTLYVRSFFSPSQDVVIKVSGRFGYNGQVNFLGGFLVPRAAPMKPEALDQGLSFHQCGDDATPWCLNGTYIGGNHGASDVIEVTSKAHGLTVADLGSAWRDATNVTFYVLKIFSPDQVWVMSENKGKEPYWSFTRALKGPGLTRLEDGKTLAVESSKLVQLWPACRINRKEYLVDGKNPLAEGAPTNCAFLDIAEDYDIVCPDAVLEAVKKNPGKENDFVAPGLAAVVNNRIAYRFLPQGACVVKHHSAALRDFQLSYMGFIQSAPLKRGDFDTHEYFVPKTLPFKVGDQQFDFKAIQDFSFPLKAGCEFMAAKNNLEDPANPPDRFIQFLGNTEGGKTARKIGYALGYSLIEGITRPEIRAKNAKMPLWIWKTSKTYPHAIDDGMGKEVKAGTEFDCTAYRQYFDATANTNATCVYGHRQGDAYILYAHYHRPVEKDLIPLPPSLAGRKVTVIEKTPSVTVLSGAAVTAEGIAVSVTGAYGHIVFKM